MNAACLIHHLFAILLASTFIPAATAQETPAPSSPAPEGCADSVISFSPCLPYISAPPNDLSNEPSSQCCDIFNGAFDSDEAECLCYLVRQNSLLGFPLNVTRLLFLSDLCSVKNNSQANNTTINSLESICSGSPTLPPLIATTKKPPSGRSSPPPPDPRPPPTAITITKPRPANNINNNASRHNTTKHKPSTSQQSGIQEDAAAYIWCFFFGFAYVIMVWNIAAMEP